MELKENIQALLGQVKDLKAANAEELEALRIKYLSKKGEITSLFNEFRTVPAEQKRELGQLLNHLRQETESRINELKETIDPEEQTVYVVHADCLEDAQKLEQMVKEALPKVNTYITYIGPIIGASIGPGAVGVFAFGKRVTFEG